jgi:FKBP-type peptidyl-prolyl cis-trans isomerase SlpA
MIALACFFVVVACNQQLSMDTAGDESALKGSKEVNMVQDGSKIKVHYTLTVEGSTVDSSEGKAPLEVTVGQDQLISGFENAMMGMKQGEKKSFTVSPEEGYGPENLEAFKEVPKSQLPEDITPEVGMTLYAKASNGQQIPLNISDVKEDVIIVNMNHPLAGKTLNFDIEIVEIN